MGTPVKTMKRTGVIVGQGPDAGNGHTFYLVRFNMTGHEALVFGHYVEAN